MTPGGPRCDKAGKCTWCQSTDHHPAKCPKAPGAALAAARQTGAQTGGSTPAHTPKEPTDQTQARGAGRCRPGHASPGYWAAHRHTAPRRRTGAHLMMCVLPLANEVLRIGALLEGQPVECAAKMDPKPLGVLPLAWGFASGQTRQPENGTRCHIFRVDVVNRLVYRLIANEQRARAPRRRRNSVSPPRPPSGAHLQRAYPGT